MIQIFNFQMMNIQSMICQLLFGDNDTFKIAQRN